MDALEAIVNDARRPLASLAVLAVRNGNVVFEAAFGHRDIAARLPATPDTLYRVASISKLVTAIGFMQLVESGQVELDRDVAVYLGNALRNPAFPDEAITAGMLLSHTSSMRDEGDLFPARVGQRLEQALKSGASGMRWGTTTGEGPANRYFHYANVNYVLLGTLIERVSGQRFDRYMQQRVFQPLRLRASFNPVQDFDPTELQQLATLYRKSPDQGRTWDASGPWVPQGPDRTGIRGSGIPRLEHYVVGDNGGVFGPQGSLRISVRGLGTLMRLMLNQGNVDGVQILRPTTVQAMLEPQWVFNGNPRMPNGNTYRGLFYAWGLGPQRFTDHGGEPGSGDRISATGGFRGAGHLGDAYGLLSGLVFDPVTRNGMVFAIGGVSADPERYRGVYSAFSRWEEAVLATLQQHTLAPAVR
ncbi:MAG TPA: serine hydrolase [Rubrivivax sp.]|nr:serine hydrolase [Rubrivivax sp.]